MVWTVDVDRCVASTLEYQMLKSSQILEHRDVEGGPVAFFSGMWKQYLVSAHAFLRIFADNIAAWYNTLGTAADVTANVLGDGLMVQPFLSSLLSLIGSSALSMLCVLE